MAGSRRPWPSSKSKVSAPCLTRHRRGGRRLPQPHQLLFRGALRPSPGHRLPVCSPLRCSGLVCLQEASPPLTALPSHTPLPAGGAALSEPLSVLKVYTSIMSQPGQGWPQVGKGHSRPTTAASFHSQQRHPQPSPAPRSSVSREGCVCEPQWVLNPPWGRQRLCEETSVREPGEASWGGVGGRGHGSGSGAQAPGW